MIGSESRIKYVVSNKKIHHIKIHNDLRSDKQMDKLIGMNIFDFVKTL